MVATNPFLIDTLSDPVYATFFHPWIIYPSLHFDVQFCCFFYLTETCWQSQPPLTAFVFSENISFILSLLLSLHRISPIYSKWKMTKNNFILFPHPHLAGAPFPGCLLPFCVPVTESSYFDLRQCHLPFPHLSHPALVPSLPHSSFLSLTLTQFSVLTIKACFSLYVLNPYLTSFAPPIALPLPFIYKFT